ncbi:hypothetical protein ACQ4PT_035803 [Festuca glaucescens]
MAAPSRLSQQGCITVLPVELLLRIGEGLPWGRDVANFRLTGRLWRDTVPLVNFSPLLMLPFDPESPDGAVTFYRPTDGETTTLNLPALSGKVVCGSSHGWLALMDVSGSLTLLNPFTGATVDLPPADKYIVEASFLRYAWMDADGSRWLVHSSDGCQRRPVRLDEARDVFFRDIVLSSPPYSGGCVAMRFLVIGLSREVSICDLADIASPRVTLLRSLVLPNELNPRGYLQLNGELHVVGSLMHGDDISYSTQVYKCDVFAMKPSWLRVKDTGDMTLFVSKTFMTGLGGPSVAGLTKNSVYFSEHLDGPQEDLDHELEISDVDNGGHANA